MNKIIAITPGEPSGIGPDITLKCLSKKINSRIFVIYDIEHLRYRAKKLNLNFKFKEINIYEDIKKCDGKVIYCQNVNLVSPVKIGIPCKNNSSFVIKCLKTAIKACLDNRISAMVTGPVDKTIINKSGVKFSGHTEFISKITGGNPIMMIHSSKNRVCLMTTHIRLKDVSRKISYKDIISKTKVINNELKIKFKIKKPRIFITGLNPHAGESGYLGNEENKIIKPAIDSLKRSGIDVYGPYPADTIFHKGKCDVIVSMYHDQILPVLKNIEFNDLVNTTLGLPITRTSVDHGTAYDLAGTKKASEKSLLKAINVATKIS